MAAQVRVAVQVRVAAQVGAVAAQVLGCGAGWGSGAVRVVAQVRLRLGWRRRLGCG